MAEISVFGGAFDPPTLAHLSIAKAVADSSVVDEVWVLPSYNGVLKDSYHLPFDKRMDLCRRTFGSLHLGNLRVLSLEKLNGGGASLDLLNMLARMFPQHNFRLVLGADAMEQIGRGLWRHSDRLMDEVNFIFFPRPGTTLPPGFFDGWRGSVAEVPCSGPMDISSTAVRLSLASLDYLGAARMLAPETLSTIIEDNLYGAR